MSVTQKKTKKRKRILLGLREQEQSSEKIDALTISTLM
jgi:hypothetical protein